VEAARTDPYESIRLDNQLCFSLYACAKEIVRQYRTPLEPLGLTYTQYVVMMVLWECGSITEKELGEKIHLDSGTLAPLLKRLEKQGLVKRERPVQNERVLRITLTDEGIALQENALSVPETMKNCIGLNTKECSILRKLLDKSLSAMERRSKEEHT
jgi:DNA-binding MarR family transcriptional regulator